MASKLISKRKPRIIRKKSKITEYRTDKRPEHKAAIAGLHSVSENEVAKRAGESIATTSRKKNRRNAAAHFKIILSVFTQKIIQSNRNKNGAFAIYTKSANTNATAQTIFAV